MPFSEIEVQFNSGTGLQIDIQVTVWTNVEYLHLQSGTHTGVQVLFTLHEVNLPTNRMRGNIIIMIVCGSTSMARKVSQPFLPIA